MEKSTKMDDSWGYPDDLANLCQSMLATLRHPSGPQNFAVTVGEKYIFAYIWNSASLVSGVTGVFHSDTASLSGRL